MDEYLGSVSGGLSRLSSTWRLWSMRLPTIQYLKLTKNIQIKYYCSLFVLVFIWLSQCFIQWDRLYPYIGR